MECGRIGLLYLITTFDIGGAEKAMVRILSGLSKDKFDITAVALRDKPKRLLAALEKTGAKIQTLGGNSKYDLIRPAFRLHKMLKKTDTKVLICSLFPSVILGRIVGKLSKVPVVVGWHHHEHFRRGILEIFPIKITNALCDMTLCDSKRVGNVMKKRFNYNDDSMKILPIGGIDLSIYKRSESSGNTTVKVGSVGRLEKTKGYEYLVRSAKIVLEQREKIDFFVAGYGSEFDGLQNLIHELSLSDRFHLLGYRDDIPDLLSQWDIYVQPSLGEGLCITVIEAMASSLPIVGTNVGGIPESVVDGLSGFLVLPEEPEAIADRILQLAEDPSLRVQMGKRSREIAESKYSLSKMTNDIEKTIEGLIRAKIGLFWNHIENEWQPQISLEN